MKTISESETYSQLSGSSRGGTSLQALEHAWQRCAWYSSVLTLALSCVSPQQHTCAITVFFFRAPHLSGGYVISGAQRSAQLMDSHEFVVLPNAAKQTVPSSLAPILFATCTGVSATSLIHIYLYQTSLLVVNYVFFCLTSLRCGTRAPSKSYFKLHVVSFCHLCYQTPVWSVLGRCLVLANWLYPNTPKKHLFLTVQSEQLLFFPHKFSSDPSFSPQNGSERETSVPEGLPQGYSEAVSW